MLRFEQIAETVERHHPGADLDILRRAYMFSAVAHKGQTRASGEPYLSHPLEVANLLAEWRLDPISVAVGLLHDALEDTLATPEELKEKFGDVVFHVVEGVTKISQISFESAEERQAESFRKLLLAMVDDVRVILVKLADRLHNMRTLQHLREDKRVRIAQETLDIYAALAGRLGMSRIKNELEDLAFQYIEPGAYRDLKERVDARRADAEAFIARMRGTMLELAKKQGIEAQVDGRVKRLYSIHRKLVRQKIELDQLYDLVALRVIVPSIGDCYALLGLLHHAFRPVPDRIKDFIAIPRPNGYRSLHTSLVGDNGMPFEVQIRTAEMHRIAEEGIAAHWVYKEGRQGLSRDDETFAWLRQVLDWEKEVQDPKEFLQTLKLDLYPEEVYCFTPKGKVLTLPRGATPIDFAFAIHTEVGRHCAGARVGGKMAPLRTRLKNGDIVEILTSPGHHPSRDWLNFAVTSRARSKIKHDLHVAERHQARELGGKLLERELRKTGHKFRGLEAEAAKIEAIGRDLGVNGRVDDVIAAVGYGKLGAATVAGRLSPPAANADVEAPKPPKKKAQAPGRDEHIRVNGVDGLLVYRARCCSPIRGDAIVGYVTRGQGVSVHLDTCPNLSNAVVDPQRRISVSWEEDAGDTYPVRLAVEVDDRPGLLAAATTMVANSGADIRRAEARTFDDRPGTIDLVVMVRDVAHLKSLMQALRGLAGIRRVERAAPDAERAAAPVA
jgi:GTP pyrophosphokinase